MADQFDQASDREMSDREHAIASHLAKSATHCNVLAKGFCLYCKEDFDLNSPKLYCDGICADRHASRMKSGRN